MEILWSPFSARRLEKVQAVTSVNFYKESVLTNLSQDYFRWIALLTRLLLPQVKNSVTGTDCLAPLFCVWLNVPPENLKLRIKMFVFLLSPWKKMNLYQDNVPQLNPLSKTVPDDRSVEVFIIRKWGYMFTLGTQETNGSSSSVSLAGNEIPSQAVSYSLQPPTLVSVKREPDLLSCLVWPMSVGSGEELYNGEIFRANASCC